MNFYLLFLKIFAAECYLAFLRHISAQQLWKIAYKSFQKLNFNFVVNFANIAGEHYTNQNCKVSYWKSKVQAVENIISKMEINLTAYRNGSILAYLG